MSTLNGRKGCAIIAHCGVGVYKSFNDVGLRNREWENGKIWTLGNEKFLSKRYLYFIGNRGWSKASPTPPRRKTLRGVYRRSSSFGLLLRNSIIVVRKCLIRHLGDNLRQIPCQLCTNPHYNNSHTECTYILYSKVHLWYIVFQHDITKIMYLSYF